MLLLLDFGNTRLKYFLHGEEGISHTGELEPKTYWKQLQQLQQDYPQLREAVAADVRGLLSSSLWKKQLQLPLLLVNAAHIALPFTTHYTSLDTLGQDRVALLAGAQAAYPHTNLFIVDVGSCITYDLLTAQGEHKGGAISPGIAMRYKSLHYYTGKLPQLEYQDLSSYLGTSTETALHAGVVGGVIAEIEAHIKHTEQICSNLTVILAGGDAQKLSKKIKKAIFAHPNLLAQGLYKLWKLNSTT